MSDHDADWLRGKAEFAPSEETEARFMAIAAKLDEQASRLDAALSELDALKRERDQFNWGTFTPTHEGTFGVSDDGKVDFQISAVDALDKAGRFDRAEVWAGKVEVENAALQSRLDSTAKLVTQQAKERHELERRLSAIREIVEPTGAYLFSGHVNALAEIRALLVETSVSNCDYPRCKREAGHLGAHTV